MCDQKCARSCRGSGDNLVADNWYNDQCTMAFTLKPACCVQNHTKRKQAAENLQNCRNIAYNGFLTCFGRHPSVR